MHISFKWSRHLRPFMKTDRSFTYTQEPNYSNKHPYKNRPKYAYCKVYIRSLVRRICLQCMHLGFVRYFLMWVGIARSCNDWLRAGRYGDRIPVEASFSASVQTCRTAHPAPNTMGTGSFPRLKRLGRGVDHPPPPTPGLK